MLLSSEAEPRGQCALEQTALRAEQRGQPRGAVAPDFASGDGQRHGRDGSQDRRGSLGLDARSARDRLCDLAELVAEQRHQQGLARLQQVAIG